MSQFPNSRLIVAGALMTVLVFWLFRDEVKSSSPIVPMSKRIKQATINAPVSKPQKTHTFSIIKTAGDGDCFFSAVRLAFPKRQYKNKQLRSVVSDGLNEDHYLNAKSLYESLKGLEYELPDAVAQIKYMQPVLKDNPDNDKGLKKMKKAVKQKTYWADEMVYEFIEKFIGANIHVLAPVNGKMVFLQKPQSGNYKNNIILLLRMNHYELIEVNGKRQLQKKEVKKFKDFIDRENQKLR